MKHIFSLEAHFNSVSFLIRTVLSRITNDNRRFWTQSKVIDGLNFEVIGSKGVCVVYVVLQPLGGGILPLLPGVSSFPPHQILQVGPIPLSVAYGLKAQVSCWQKNHRVTEEM